MADKNKVTFGLDQMHYSIIEETVDDVTGEVRVSYGTPKRYRGAVELTIDPQGETSEFYADDIVYYAEDVNNGYSGSLEMAMHTDQVAQDIFGNTIDETTGMLVENLNDRVKQVALLFEFNGDKNKTRHVLYNVRLARPAFGSRTKEGGLTVKTVTYNITATGSADLGILKAKSAPETPSYETFFDAVIVPTGTPEA